MQHQTGFIAVDWGTTNRRIFLIGPDGLLRSRSADRLGVLAMRPGLFEPEIEALRVRHGDRPMLLAGMVGSNRGWMETPYLSCPVDAAMLARALMRPGGGDVAIVPGVSFEDGVVDVMRGEEVQVLGAVAAGMAGEDAVICHPGTHAKWVIVEKGAIRAFRTLMTGELFGLIRRHGILAELLQGIVAPGDAFRAAVRHALDHCDLTAALFTLRAEALLGRAAAADAASRASGLLVGADIRFGLDFAGDAQEILLIGEPELTGLYAVALQEAGRASRVIDGERAFLAGATLIADHAL